MKLSKRNTLGIVILTLIIFIITPLVFAGFNEKRNSSFANGLTTAIAEKYVTTNFYHDKVNCTSTSYTNYPYTNITQIGYNTFSCRSERSDGDVHQITYLVGDLDNNDWHHTHSVTLNAPLLNGHTRTGIAAGSHHFGHFNGSSYYWDPPLSAVDVFYP